MEERRDECFICGREVEEKDVKDVLCPDCLDTWQRENETTW